MSSFMRWLAGAIAVCTTAGACAAPPVVDFLRRPRVRDVVVSPSGRYAALEARRDVGRVQISVIDLEHPEDSRIVAGWGDVDAVGVRWLSDDRLVFAAVDLGVNWDDWRSYTKGWMAVDRDGSRLRSGAMGLNGRPAGSFDDGTPDVVALRHNGDTKEPRWSLWRMNTRTGYDQPIAEDSPKGSYAWTLDENGRPRAVQVREGDRSVLYRVDDDSHRWVRVLDEPLFGRREIMPLTYRYGQMYVVASAGDAGLRGVYTYDLAQRKLADKPLVVLQGFDFEGSLVFDTDSHRLIGLWHLTEDWSRTWLDPDMQALQAKIDERLPGLVNQIVCTRCLQARRLVVRSYSDRQPVVFSVYDRQSGDLQVVARSRPWIDARAMGRREMTRFSARDGLPIPVTVTYPPGARDDDPPRPAVILLHPGPWVRGVRWGWSAEPQLLASRGYVVLEPEFRGSDGFGDRHMRAGFKQWGLAMQDDVADTATWAAARHLIDPKRVCLAGSGYGGYATLMGLIRHPQQFRCGISWGAPTDLDALYDIGWDDWLDIVKRHGLPALLGDRQRDAEQLRATSPLKLAAQLRQPLLLAHGGQDRRVPIAHGERLRDALKATNPKVEWVEYRTEGEGWFLLDNDVDFWTRAERFLAEQLQPGPDTR